MALTVRKIFAAFAVVQVVLSVRIGDDQPASPAKPPASPAKPPPPAGGASPAKPPPAKPPPADANAAAAADPNAVPAAQAGAAPVGEEGAPASEDMCDGTHQSPIDIISVPSVPANGTDLLQYMAYNATDYWRVASKENKSFAVIGKFGTLNLGSGFTREMNVEYTLGSIHFRFPSEHTIDNKTLAGEMQLRHTAPNGSKVIVSILFEEDEVEENDFLTTISQFPTLTEKPIVGNGTLSVLPGFQEQLAGSYYSYAGSMTLPPCTEGVDWYIMQETARVSAEQISSFMETFGGQTQNRELQPLNDRTVCFNTFADACLNMSVVGEEPEGGEEAPAEVDAEAPAEVDAEAAEEAPVVPKAAAGKKAKGADKAAAKAAAVKAAAVKAAKNGAEAPKREPIKVCAAVTKPSCERCNKYTATDKKVKKGPDCWYVASEGKCASQVLVKSNPEWIVPKECQAAGKPAPPAAGAAGAVPAAGAAGAAPPPPADGAAGAAPAPEGGDAPAPEGGDAPAPEGGDAPAPEGEEAPAAASAEAPAAASAEAPAAASAEAPPASEFRKQSKKKMA